MKLLKMFGALVFALSLIGCASVNIAPEERTALKRVNVAAIELPDKPVVWGPSSGGTFVLTGALGLAIAQGISDLPAAYKQTLAKNRIDVAAYIKTELRNQLVSKGIEVVESPGQADAVMSIQILQYGLTGDVISDTRFPQLWANFKLTKRNGDVIWKNMGAAHISQNVQKQVEARPIPDYFNDPKFLDSQIRKVHRIVIAEAIRSL